MSKRQALCGKVHFSTPVYVPGFSLCTNLDLDHNRHKLTIEREGPDLVVTTSNGIDRIPIMGNVRQYRLAHEQPEQPAQGEPAQ